MAEADRPPAYTFERETRSLWASTYTTQVDTGLNPGTTYRYYVVACNEHGCSVVPSPVGSGATAGG